LDLFSGLGGWSQPALDAGHEVVRVELDPKFSAVPGTVTMDVRDFKETGFDLVLASPPCQGFSVAAIGRNWRSSLDAGYVPVTDSARLGLELAKWTFETAPKLGRNVWIENPRAMLRTQSFTRALPRATVTYCQYGLPFQKPTDLWGVWPAAWKPKAMCKPKQPCHEAASRGAKTGLQGVRDPAKRSLVPYALGKEVLEACR
jgi:site-specific DNA-cytosine methylase